MFNSLVCRDRDVSIFSYLEKGAISRIQSASLNVSVWVGCKIVRKVERDLHDGQTSLKVLFYGFGCQERGTSEALGCRVQRLVISFGLFVCHENAHV